ncbi:EpsG family protein [Robertkochia marina]|uniref:EpsG family protein n=1 Tax=Robertkochia marina TaxID=1227945 RepID=A0A4S3M150_9FLAO|nr:EpsG family protein [Robertkochia marina]THD66777.1 EpsG family protein [Robertkochia marina]TRZ41932.1 EpsG family protein [Robertkochia marina]
MLDPSQYFNFYINVCLVIVLIINLHAFTLSLHNNKNSTYLTVFGILLFSFVILFMGFRPISWHFGDMVTYSRHFTNYANGMPFMPSHDYLFEWFLYISSQTISVELFFFLCSLFYTVPLLIISIKLFQNHWVYAFVILIVSFSFWTYGTNGIRNGIATSFFLLALSFQKSKPTLVILSLAAALIHQSILLPILAYFIVLFKPNTKLYFMIWFLSIPLSLILGGFWENLFASLGFGGERLGDYLTSEEFNNSFKSTGFRFDFLLYSMAPVFVGYYFVFRKNYTDQFYHILLNIYLLTNAFWILVIRASFSNRFAYLSWFMMGLVIIYPFLKMDKIHSQHIRLSRVISSYFLFTYLMNYVYYI